nr:hypothetical protein [Streptomyces sp. ISL-98]
MDSSERLGRRRSGATVRPRIASSGRTSPIARVMVERSMSKPARQYIMGGTMAEVNEGGQQAVAKDQFVLGPSTYGPTTGPRRECSLVPLVRQRADLGDEFSDQIGRQARDPLASDDRCTFPLPHHRDHDQRSDSRRATANHARAR